MIVAIVEDEPLIAARIERMIRDLMGGRLTRVLVLNSLAEAENFLFEFPVDLLLLDLNLHGRDGFELLKQAVSGSFHTIIISAHTDQAIRAFEYGVLDFIAKPFTAERLAKALARLDHATEKNICSAKYIAVRKNRRLHLIEVDSIAYIRGAGIYSEIVLQDGNSEIHDKTLARLETVLPPSFVRIHRSHIVNIHCVRSFSTLGGSRYRVQLRTNETLPVSRHRFKAIRDLLSR